MKVYYDDSPAGFGKTTRAITSIWEQPCKTLFVTERKNSFNELEAAMRQSAAQNGVRPTITTIHSEATNRGGSVVKELESLPERYAGSSSLAVIATHAALLRANFNNFKGWRIIIDEVPTFLDFEEKCTPLNSEFFQRHYRLEQVTGRWHAVTLTTAGESLTTADLRADQSYRHLSTFHARVKQASHPSSKRIVLSNLASWPEMADRNVQWCWASVFSLHELAMFDRVELLGNRFRSDIGPILSDRLDVDDVEWSVISRPPTGRQFNHRAVTIHYFADRPASKSLFSTKEGREALSAIGAHLATVLPKGRSIWTANETADHGLPSPKALLGLPDADYLRARLIIGTLRYVGSCV